MKNYIKLLIFLLIFSLFPAIVSASEDVFSDEGIMDDYQNMNMDIGCDIVNNNQSQASLIDNSLNKVSNNNIDTLKVSNNGAANLKVSNDKLLESHEDVMNLTNDCCTTIMQVSDNEAVLSFRRDSAGSTINLYVSNNSSFIKQYKTSGSYFFHVLISKDGWMVGNGGADNQYINRRIESKALDMIKNNKITTAQLNSIASLQKSLAIAHFIIKAPDGRYGAVVYRNGAMVKSGKLFNGEYIVCPNSKVYYHKGNYATYTKTNNILHASRLLAFRDPYGINRRNIMTYHFKRNETTSTIDFYAGNDNGAYVGRHTGYLKDNIVTNSKTVYAGNLPTSVGGMFIQRYTYIVNASYKPKVNFIVSSSDNLTKMGNRIKFNANLSIDNKNVNRGYVIFKINGLTIRDSSNNTVKAYLKDGFASIDYVIPDGWSAKPFKLTAVFSKSNYGRIENKSYFNLTRPDIHMQLENITSNTRNIHVHGLLLDEHNHRVRGVNVFAVKVSGLTLKKDGKVLLFNVADGIIDISFTLADYYRNANHTIILSTGTRGAYNSARGVCNLNLVL